MEGLKKFIFNKYWLWLIIAIPALFATSGFLTGNMQYGMLMHMTGEFAGRFLVISLIATPIALMFPNATIPKWLIRNRRYFGVGAFAYTMLHTIFYLYEINFTEVMGEFFTIGLISGWIALFIFIPLAITSNDKAVKRMGPAWKKLQRWVYLAGVMTFIHWAFVHYHIDGSIHWGPALFHFVPVMILQVYRVWKQNRS